jgi:hypothetical protein
VTEADETMARRGPDREANTDVAIETHVDDFDQAEWREDTKAFVQSCRELDVPVSLEISRSGNGAHAWVFFTTAVPARDARRLGTAIISHTCSRKLGLSELTGNAYCKKRGTFTSVSTFFSRVDLSFAHALHPDRYRGTNRAADVRTRLAVVH